MSGRPYRDYVDREILAPLGMTSTNWEEASVPECRFARGHRRDGELWVGEEQLPDGAFGAIGGLYSTVPDLARWVSFFLACDRGHVRFSLTLAPTPKPAIQWLEATSVLPLGRGSLRALSPLQRQRPTVSSPTALVPAALRGPGGRLSLV